MQFFFSPAGRLSRRDWWRIAVPVLGFAFIAAGLVDLFYLSGSFWIGPARIVLGGLLLWPTIALFSRRLHDIDWGAATLMRDAAILAAGPAIALGGAMLTGEGFSLFVIAGAFVFLWALVNSSLLVWMMSTRRGQPGPNRYGPDPLAPSVA